MESLLPERLSETSDASTLATQWSRFKRQFIWFLAANDKADAADAVKLAILLRTVGPRGIDIYDNFNLTDEQRKVYDTVITAFDEFCKPRVNLFAARHKFLTMKQGDLTIDQFVTALRKQAREYCDFGETSEDMTLHALTLGLADDGTRRRLFEKENLTLDVAIKLCRTIEDTRREMEGLKLNEEVNAVYKRSASSTNSAKSHQPDSKPGNSCQYCGTVHAARQCPAFGKKCNLCQSLNHFARVCRKKRGETVKAVEHQEADTVHSVAEDQSETEDAWQIQVTREGRKLVAQLKVLTSGTKDPQWIKTQLDTAATCNILSAGAYIRLGSPPLAKSDTKLKMYNGALEQSRGRCTLRVVNNDHPLDLEFQVVDCQNITLLSLDSCLLMRLLTVGECVEHVNLVNDGDAVEWALDKYKDVFVGLGQLPGEYDIQTEPAIPAVQNRPRRIPLALKADLIKKLENLEAQTVITKVDEPTPWISNLLAMRKPSGSIRVCLDPTDLNKSIQRNHYPLPTLEDVLPALKEAKVFSLVDAKDGFLQVVLSEKSSYLTTFWTPKGRYRWTRMPFGLSSSPEEFQRRLNMALEGLEGIAVVADDVLVVGRGPSMEEAMRDHDQNFVALLQRARERGLKLNREKLRLRLKEIPYIGHIISKDGVRADPGKQRDIQEMKTPKTVEELRRFLGFANYLSRFMPHLATVTEPMRALLVKGVTFKWDKEQDEAFKSVKRMAQSSETLGFYDHRKPVTIQCDASTVGLGAVLLQNDKPIAYASRSLTKCERNYAPIELECLAVVYSCHRFDQYIYGHPSVTIHTDHLPLEAILTKSLLMAPKRLQRMRLMLQRYDMRVKYRPGSEQVIADMLSRAPSNDATPIDLGTEQVFQLSEWQRRADELDSVNPEQHAHVGEAKLDKVREAGYDDEMIALKQTVRSGWPSCKEAVATVVRKYWNFRDELAIYRDIVYKGERIIVPESMRKQVLTGLHSSHQGIEATLRRARDCVFWPGLTADVKQMSENCSRCQTMRSSQHKETLRSHAIPNSPWTKVGMDLFQKGSDHYLVIVDYQSDYFEINKLSSLDSSAVIGAAKEQFARHGIPDVVHSDGGPQFISDMFRSFSAEWGFDHTMSSPYHSQSNGKAESAVKIAKGLLERTEDPNLALLEWRNTPSSVTGYSPVQRLLGRRTRSILPQSVESLKPQTVDGERVVQLKSAGNLKSQKYYNVGAKDLPVLRLGQPVYVQDLRKFSKGRWNPGRVVRVCNDRSFIVDTGGTILRRNRRYLRPSHLVPDSGTKSCERSDVARMPAELPAQGQGRGQGASCERSDVVFQRRQPAELPTQTQVCARSDVARMPAELPDQCGPVPSVLQSCERSDVARRSIMPAELPAQSQVCVRSDVARMPAELPDRCSNTSETPRRYTTRTGRETKWPAKLKDFV